MSVNDVYMYFDWKTTLKRETWKLEITCQYRENKQVAEIFAK